MPPISLLLLAVTAVGVCAGKAKDAPKNRLTVDGKEFTINQKNYKPAKFSMYGNEFDDTYGFVRTDYLPLDNRGYAEVLEQCDLEASSIPLHQYSSHGTLNYYPSNEEYDNWKGYDLVPENKHNYEPGNDYSLNLNFKDGKKKFYDKEIQYQSCRIPQDDGGAWHVQRVGPIISTGGYDWWQVAWPDVGMFSEALKKYPQGIDVIKEIFVPVLKDGTRLNFPPIHTHHFHTVTQPGIRPRLKMRPMCLQRSGLGIDSLDSMIRETGCYNLSMFFEQHGDYICQPEDDGLDCLTQGDKSPRRLTQAIDLEGELNDVRPFNSEPLEWYYMVAMRWKPADKAVDPYSQFILMGPGYIFPPSQLTKSNTSPCPTRAQSVMTYHSQMEYSGELVRMKFHSHAGIFESAMLLRGVPADFGLGDKKFVPQERAYFPLVTTELGFRDNDDLAQHILFHMKKSQELWDAECEVKKNLREPICLRPRPDWMCGAMVDYAQAEFEGVSYNFDRRPKTWCKPWTFRHGDDFMGIGFNRHVTEPPAPHEPHSIPARMGQHLGFVCTYKPTEPTGHSVVDITLHGHDGPFYHFNQQLSPPQLLARIFSIVLWSGPPVYIGTVYFIEWMFVAFFTVIAGGLGYLMFWGLRKIPAFDQMVTIVFSNVALFFNTSKVLAAAATGKGHAYEMVSLMETDEDLAEDERTM